MSKTLVSGLLLKLDREIRANKILSELEETLSFKDSIIEEGDRLIPRCCSCQKINVPEDNWQLMENFLLQTGQEFTHTICPDCMEKLYPEISYKIKVKDGYLA